MSIVIVRHGQTPLNVARVLQTEDTPLSETGLDQAERLAPRLSELGVRRVLCSDYIRARQTIAPFERRSGVSAELQPLLRERHFGELRGRPYGELPNVFSREYQPPGGESWVTFEQRVADAWALIVREASVTEGTLAVITHGLVCYALLRHHLSLPPDLAGPDSFKNGSLTLADREAPHLVRVLNCVAHLPV
jgi:broad specificity phosphatase PhoE